MECLFCQIIEKKIPSEIIYEYKYFISLKKITP